ncbi:MAG TPA: phosphoribosyltransferase [Firmicutes bacterium]|nr:phosphoribosyltransferase [Bacillota bacterium]
MFRDRQEAGRMLAERLKHYKGSSCMVIALPRGGVPVAAEIARELESDLDIVAPRKIGAPDNPELAIGAVAHDGTLVLNDELVEMLDVGSDYIYEAVRRERGEVERRMERYRGRRPLPSFEEKTVIIVDDGLATGYTMLAALRAIKKDAPARIVIAVPVAPPDTAQRLSREVDEAVILATPEPFYAVGQFYWNFDPVTDDEVQNLLKWNRPR